MSDYARQNDGATHFGDRDARTTGDPDKKVVGAHFDTEFDAILVAVNSKYDSDDLATQAQAEGETVTTKLVTPRDLGYWSDANAGVVGELQALADPNADGLLGWDDSAAADSNVIFFTAGTGLGFNGTTIEMSHLGIEDLTDPGANRLFYWDDTDGATNWLTINNGLTIDQATDSMGLTDVAATTTNPIDISSGAIDVDLEALDTIEGSALASTDRFLVDDGGVPKAIQYHSLGMQVKTSQTTQNLALLDMNTIMKFSGTATLTIQQNSTTDLPLGVPVVLIMDHASQELTVQADTLVTLESVFHPGGTANASDVVRAGGMAVLVQTETDVWQLSGDTST